MPTVFINPSNQEDNRYVNGGNEEEYMNLIADAMVPYLRASGIQFERSNPWEPLSEVIERANHEQIDLFLSLQSASAPPELSGALQGPDIYYFVYNPRGKTAAQLIAENLNTIYPKPGRIMVVPNKSLRVLRDIHPVSVLANIGYHDNAEDAQWIRDNINAIAKQLVLSIAEYLKTPFVDVSAAQIYNRS